MTGAPASTPRSGHAPPPLRFSSRGLALSAAFVLLVTVLFAGRFTREMPDFEVYWKSAVRAAAGEPLYRVEDQHYQFKYLPAFALLAAPVGALPIETAKTVWFGISVALLILLVATSIRLPIDRRVPGWLLAVAAVVTMGKFYGHELVLGQVNLLFGCLITVALLLLRGGRDTAAGLLIAAAIVVKPYAVIFLPWLTATGRLAAVGAAFAGLLAALVAPAIVYGAAGTAALHEQWWLTVTSSTAPNLLNQDNVSLAAMAAKWVGPGTAAGWIASLTGLLVVGLTAAIVRARSALAFPEGLEGAALLTLIPLLSPQGWDYVFLVATPAAVYLVNHRAQLAAGWRVAIPVTLAAIGLSIFDLMGRAAYARFMALSIITLCFIAVLAALASLRFRRIA